MKKRYLIFSIFVFTGVLLKQAVFAQLPTYVPTDSLRAFWPFSGNANDHGGNNIHGTVNGSTLTTDRFGNPNSAYYFDGVNDWIDFGDNDLLNPHLHDMTVNAWVKTTSPYSRIYSKGTHGGTQPGYAIMLYPSTGGKAAVIFGPSAHEHNLTRSDALINDNTWHMVTGAMDRDGRTYLYIDGILQILWEDISHDASVDIAANTYNATAGVSYCSWGAPFSLSEFFQGVIDEIGVWNRVLTACEIKNLYKSGVPDTLISPETCNTYTAPDGVIYSSTGTYTAIIPDHEGCDSIIEIHLTKQPSYYISEYDTISDGASVTWHGNVYSIPGTYTESYLSSYGCDSVYTLHLTKNFDSGQLCDWQYFSEITINNSGNTDTLTDYSVLAYVNTAQLITDGKVNANGSDIRFTTNFSDNLEYWIEPGIQNEHGMNDDSTHIWVKVPVIPASEIITLYMFYGNPTATAKSNISTTFLFGDDFDDNSPDLSKWDLFTSNSGQIIEQNQRIQHNSPTSMPESSSAIFSKQGFTGPVAVEMQFKKGGYVYRGAGMMDNYNVNQNSAWIGWQDWGGFGPGVTIASVSQGVPFRNDTWSRQYNPEYYLKIYRKADSTFKFIGHIPPFEDNGYKYWTHTFTTAKMPLDVPLKVGASEYVWSSAWWLWDRYEDNIRVRKYSEPEPVCSIITELETNIPDSIVYDSICSNDSLLWRAQYYSTAGTYYDSLYSQVGCDSVFVLHLYIHTIPDVSVSNDTICLGENAMLTATGAATYEWNTGATNNPYTVSPGITTVYTVTGTDGNLCSNTAQAHVVVQLLPIDLNDPIPTKINEITADANTIVLDHLNNSSSGDLHGALTFVESVCGLNYAGNFDDGEWIHYGYNANLRDAATVDMWIYPTSYSTPLVDFNWSNTASYPGGGHVFHLDLNAAGHIIMSNWPGTGLGALETNGVVPLNQWTHVAVSWGDSTVMYLNGNVDKASAGSFRPSANGPYHIYVPKWGSANDLLIDEFHVSNKRRSQTEIRQGYRYIGIYADDDTICANTSSNIIITNPQFGISYQLLSGGTPVGSPQTGDCADLVFNTGNLTSGSTFTLEATNPGTGCGIVFDTTILITVHPVFEFPTFAETCDNASYVWRGNTYDLTGVYYDSLVTQYGCDSVYVLTLIVHPTFVVVENEEICDGDIFIWRGNNYTLQGTYYDSLLTINNCDSVYVLNLKVNPTFELVQNEQICNGDIFTWRGNTYTSTGTYYDSLYTIHNCDSVYVLNLLVHPSYELITNASVCEGDVFSWHGMNFTNPGIYYDSLLTTQGCDSIHTLHLTINAGYLSESYAEICDGQQYTWRGNIYTTNGIYYDSLATIFGCDSVYSLYLSVFPLPSLNIAGLDTFYCEYHSVVAMTGTPAGGFFLGQGVSGNVFDPAAAGVGNWTITYHYTDTNLCSNYLSIYVHVDVCISVDGYIANVVNIYPNPTNGQFIIRFDDEFSNVYLKITDITGALIHYHFYGNTSQIEHLLIDEPAGLYFIEIISQQGNYVLKIMKE